MSGRTGLFLGWSAINLIFAGLGLAVLFWSLGRREDQREQFARLLAERREDCAPTHDPRQPAALRPEEPRTAAPRQDPLRSGTIHGHGAGIAPAMRLELEVLRPGKKGLETLRLGAPQVLAPRMIHVVNLWATWCEPCLDELPAFRELFAEHRGWDDVRFVPIQVKDHTDPLKSYRNYAGIMPAAPVQVADRTEDNALVSVLAAAKDGGMYRGDLPVTLVLDCNRRVRWAKFGKLERADFGDLEPLIERLRAEREDRREGAWCTREWRGNGVCTASERTAEGHSFEDCGPLQRSDAEVAPVLAELPPQIVPLRCPPGTRLVGKKCSRLQKIPDLRVDEPLLVPPKCGDNVCGPGEDRDNCCRDCPCPAPLRCTMLRDGEAPRCLGALLP